MPNNQDLVIRRKQLRYRANHRGIKEMDIILGKFADRFLDECSSERLDAFEALMEHNDRDLLQWFTFEQEAPVSIDLLLFKQISDYATGNIDIGNAG